jgi:hypothetical protein
MLPPGLTSNFLFLFLSSSISSDPVFGVAANAYSKKPSVTEMSGVSLIHQQLKDRGRKWLFLRLNDHSIHFTLCCLNLDCTIGNDYVLYPASQAPAYLASLWRKRVRSLSTRSSESELFHRCRSYQRGSCRSLHLLARKALQALHCQYSPVQPQHLSQELSRMGQAGRKTKCWESSGVPRD